MFDRFFRLWLFSSLFCIEDKDVALNIAYIPLPGSLYYF